jgi:hypothetical protein
MNVGELPKNSSYFGKHSGRVIGDYRLIIIDNNSDVRPTHPPKTHQDFHQKYGLSQSKPTSSSVSFAGIQGGKLQIAALSASCRGIV